MTDICKVHNRAANNIIVNGFGSAYKGKVLEMNITTTTSDCSQLSRVIGFEEDGDVETDFFKLSSRSHFVLCLRQYDFRRVVSDLIVIGDTNYGLLPDT
ncbi:hypothetical protein KIN20_017300 [Parelaphostrongylus tenuis]|uniref:Uncharacterized protein n=1 Tax=Parelaphostrongylus tenuis TaxID=148309 RepID=A0AAD5QQM4_PARTN|nr:hypothetical protein KIN20_017300 [Parelaphostrongylus tenuis]